MDVTGTKFPRRWKQPASAKAWRRSGSYGGYNPGARG